MVRSVWSSTSILNMHFALPGALFFGFCLFVCASRNVFVYSLKCCLVTGFLIVPMFFFSSPSPSSLRLYTEGGAWTLLQAPERIRASACLRPDLMSFLFYILIKS